MKRKLLSCLTIGALMISLNGCNIDETKNKVSSNDTESETAEEFNKNNKEAENKIATPNSIVFYNDGKEVTLTPEDKNFDEIVNLTKERVSKIEGRCKCAFPVENKEDYSSYEGGILEFVYDSDQQFVHSVIENQAAARTYTNLMFLLGENDGANETMFLYDDGTFLTFSPISSPDEVGKLLTEN